jgi:hypothetical protein
MIDGAGPTKLAIGIMMPVARSACDVTARYRGLALQIPLVGSILQVAFMSLSRPCTRRGGCGINEKDQICRKSGFLANCGTSWPRGCSACCFTRVR